MKLRDYIEKFKKTSVNKQFFASELGISLTSLYAYSAGKRTPSISLAQKILELTNGQVTSEDLLSTINGVNHGNKETSKESCEETSI